MNELLPLSPMEDETVYCDLCEEETLHVPMLTSLKDNPLAMFYVLECEMCMMSWDWQ